MGAAESDSEFDFDDLKDLDFSFCFSEPDSQPQSISLDLCNGSPFASNNFILAHWNINSIIKEGRIDELMQNIRTLNAQVLVLTESKLDHTIPNNLISLPGFHEPLRRDRNRHGGGCIMYISQKLTFKQQN